MEKIRLFILAKKEILVGSEIVKILVDYAKGNWELVDFGYGNAYNMPAYLLEAIQKREEPVMVVALEMDDELPKPRIFVDNNEVEALIEALENDIEGDSWEMAVRLNKQFRGE